MAPDLTPKKVIKHGEVRWMVDCRSIGQGRKFFSSSAKAKGWIKIRTAEVLKFGVGYTGLSEVDALKLSIYQEKLSKVGGTLEQAVDFFVANYKRVTPVQLSKAIEEFVENKRKVGKRPKYIRILNSNLITFHQFAGNKLCSEIRHEYIERWFDTAGYAAKTRNGKLIDLKTFFNWCIKRRYAVENPADVVERSALDDKPPGIFTVDECERMMEAAREHCPKNLPYFTLALFCGIRPEEIDQLTWENVDIERRFVEVPAKVAKGRQRRLVTISDNCAEWLKLGGSLPPMNRRRHKAKVGKKAGIQWSHDVLRHSFASYHLAMHQSAEKTAHELGHRSSDMLFRHYRELVTKEDAEKFWAIRPRESAYPGDAILDRTTFLVD